MGLGILIQNRSFGIISHTYRPDFVNNTSGSSQAVLVLRTGFVAHYLSTHGIKNFFEGVLHVPCLFHLMVGPFVMKAKYRNSIFIYRMRVYFTIVVVLGHTFPPTGNTYCGTIDTANVLLQSFTIATVWPGFSKFILEVVSHGVHAKTESIVRHSHASSKFQMISSGKIKLFIIQPPGSIYVHGTYPVFIVLISSQKRRHECRAAGTGRIVQVPTQGTAAIGNSVGMLW